MKKRMNRLKYSVSTIAMPLVLISNSGCQEFSETFRNEKAGMNGSFEIAESGMPVNWLLYTPNTVEEGDFQIILDPVDPQDGKQSLKFLVNDCSSVGGWYSPGFTQEYDAIPGKAYKVSFWIKNQGSEFEVKVGGVAAKTGKMETVVKSDEVVGNWKQIEYELTVPMEYTSMRFNLNVLKPGVFWIDNIQIEEANLPAG